MDPHRRAERRSLAYHRIIAERIVSDPGLVDHARRRVRAWLDARRDMPAEAQEWAGVLAEEPEEIARVLVEDTERGRALRQSTPFAGALTAEERWRVWRELRDSE